MALYKCSVAITVTANIITGDYFILINLTCLFHIILELSLRGFIFFDTRLPIEIRLALYRNHPYYNWRVDALFEDDPVDLYRCLSSGHPAISSTSD